MVSNSMLFVRYFSYDITPMNAYEDGVAYFHMIFSVKNYCLFRIFTL